MARGSPPERKSSNQCVPNAQEIIAEVERECATRGLRLTPLRADVLRLVAESDRPIKAYKLLEGIRASHARSAPPTAYRALDFLIEHGFIHKLESINAFVTCHHPAASHTAPFLICDRCHRTVEVEDDRPAALLRESARAMGFSPKAQIIEVHGLCAECAALEA